VLSNVGDMLRGEGKWRRGTGYVLDCSTKRDKFVPFFGYRLLISNELHGESGTKFVPPWYCPFRKLAVAV
jgi:hypothetical protein